MRTLPVYLRLLKASTTILFWLAVLSFGLLAVFVIQSTKLSGAPSFTFSLPNVTLNGAPAKVVKEIGRQVSFNSTAQAKISFYYPDKTRFSEDFGRYASQFLLPILLLFTLLLVGLWQIKRIFDTLGTAKVFSMANVRRIRVVACLLIVYQLLPGLIWLFIQSDIIALLNKYQVRYSIDQEVRLFDVFMTGVLLLGLAEVFRSGFQLKQEQDLTI